MAGGAAAETGSPLSMRACKECSFEAAQRGFGEHGTKLAVSYPLSTIPHSPRVERNLGVQRGRPGGAVASTRRPWVLGHGGRTHLSRRGYLWAQTVSSVRGSGRIGELNGDGYRGRCRSRTGGVWGRKIWCT
jgi:hypothetical protein